MGAMESKGKLIPKEDDLARYCRPKYFDAGRQKPSHAAFYLKRDPVTDEIIESGLSCDWLNHESISGCSLRDAVRNLQARFHPNPNGHIVRFNLSVEQFDSIIRANPALCLQSYSDRSDSHCTLYGIETNEALVANLIVDHALKQIEKVRDLI